MNKIIKPNQINFWLGFFWVYRTRLGRIEEGFFTDLLGQNNYDRILSMRKLQMSKIFEQ